MCREIDAVYNGWVVWWESVGGYRFLMRYPTPSGALPFCEILFMLRGKGVLDEWASLRIFNRVRKVKKV